jgi:signal transduction histidine kinase
MAPRSFPQRLPIAIAVVLGLLLAVLAVLQWRWIGEVSALERQRMRASLFAAGSHFTEDFDRELTRTFLSFHPEIYDPGNDPLARVAGQYERWQAEAPYPQLVRDVLVVRRGDLLVFRPAAGRFEPLPWPPELAGVRRRLTEVTAPGARRPMGEVAPDIPALIVPLVMAPPGPPRPPWAADSLIVRLDSRAITGDIFPDLTRRHFGSPQGEKYALAVTTEGSPGRPGRVVYLSDPRVPAASFHDADVRLGMLALRPFGELRSLWHGHGGGRTPVPGLPMPGMPGMQGMPHSSRDRRPEGGGGWTLSLKHRDGSLEESVAHIRRHNLGVSLGILALLGVTAGIMMVTTQAAQRLARQQIEFVAGVTHELHTPLTAIRSAGQNLADGVVADPAQVRRYGALIESEGRRLSSMVGQALDFAGIQSGRRVYPPRPADASEIVAGALQDCRWLLQEKRIEVERDVAADLPPVLADPAALRQAVANLIENAVKHGGKPGWIGVRARRDPLAAGGVEITVADRGPGIRREDLPHLFEPFFRGRDAAAESIPGSGLGLSLVRHIAEAHGGRVTVAAAVGEGSAFTLHLPAAPAAAEAQGLEEPA